MDEAEGVYQLRTRNSREGQSSNSIHSLGLDKDIMLKICVSSNVWVKTRNENRIAVIIIFWRNTSKCHIFGCAELSSDSPVLYNPSSLDSLDSILEEKAVGLCRIQTSPW